MLSSAFTRCRCRDVDFNAVVLTATGREKTTAALVSPSLIAIHVNAKTLSLFFYAPVFFSPVFLPIIGGSISGWRVPVSMSYAEPFSFFLTWSVVVFRVIVREYLVNHPLLLLLLC